MSAGSLPAVLTYNYSQACNRPSFPNASIGNPAEISKSLSAPNKQPLTLLKPTPIDGKLEWFEPYLQPQKVIERCFPIEDFYAKDGLSRRKS